MKRKLEPTGVCIKVKSLRKRGYDNLQEWRDAGRHVQVTRRGRVFIIGSKGEKRVYHYPQSPWANPFKVGTEYTLEESLHKFREYFVAKLGRLKLFAERSKAKKVSRRGCRV